MTRDKATITLDRAKARAAMVLVDGRSISDVVDIALDRLITIEQLRRDVSAYGRIPPSDAEMALADMPLTLDLGDEDVDYEALYGSNR